MIKKILSFLKKDWLIESSYKFSFVFNIASVFTGVLVYFFIDRLFGRRIVSNLSEFGTSYFPYVLVSTAFFGYIGSGFSSFADRLRAEQVEGTLEAILVTPTGVPTMLASMIAWNMVMATVDLAIYIGLGVFVFRVDFSHANILSTAMIFLLSIASFVGLGILSASFVMIFKRGNPLSWLVSSLEGLLGGVYFPVTVLPAWLQAVAGFLPITYAIRAIQLAVYRGYGPLQLWREASMLLVFSAILLPASLFVFRKALTKALRDGSLVKY